MKNIIIAIFIFSILSACGKQDNTSSAKAAETVNENAVMLTDAQIQSAGIQVGKLEKKDISTILKVNGTVDVPPQSLSLIHISEPTRPY